MERAVVAFCALPFLHNGRLMAKAAFPVIIAVKSVLIELDAGLSFAPFSSLLILSATLTNWRIVLLSSAAAD